MKHIIALICLVLALALIPAPFCTIAAGVVVLAWLATLSPKAFVAVVILVVLGLVTGVLVL